VIEKLIGSLPAGFLALLSVNIILVGGVLFLEDRLAAARERILMHLIETCQHNR
jgi:hypothetical protein